MTDLGRLHDHVNDWQCFDHVTIDGQFPATNKKSMEANSCHKKITTISKYCIFASLHLSPWKCLNNELL